MGNDLKLMVVRVRIGDLTGLAVTPTYLFEGDLVKVWIPGMDECRAGTVLGDYRMMIRKDAETEAQVDSQRLPLMEVRGKYVYEEFGR